MARVVRGTPRTPLEIVDGLAKLGSATVHEAQGRIGLMGRHLRPIFPAMIAGNALTCEVAPGDNWMIHVAVEQAQPGDILVVTPTSPCDDGYLGDLLAESLMAHGVRGLVIDAGVRDVATLTEMGFPVWSKRLARRAPSRKPLRTCKHPSTWPGQFVRPGDVIVADIDSVCLVRREDAESVLAKLSSVKRTKRASARVWQRASSVSTSTTCARSSQPRAWFTRTTRDDQYAGSRSLRGHARWNF